jgi:hypothetical protein
MLNQLLTGEAHKELSDHDTAEGLEVWRAITVNLTDKGPHKRAALLERINVPSRAKSMAGVRMVLKDWEKHLREYHAAGGAEYKTDELKVMLLRRMLPWDGKRLTHREFVEGAHGTVGESYEQLRQRVLDTIVREELEVQSREGKLFNVENNDEHLYNNNGEAADDSDDSPMEDEEFHGIFAAIDSGVMTEEQVNILQRRVQRKGRCFNCGRPGHFAKDCKSQKRRPGK